MWYVVKDKQIINEFNTKHKALSSVGCYAVHRVTAGMYRYLIKRWDMIEAGCPTELYYFINDKKFLDKCDCEEACNVGD